MAYIAVPSIWIWPYCWAVGHDPYKCTLYQGCPNLPEASQPALDEGEGACPGAPQVIGTKRRRRMAVPSRFSTVVAASPHSVPPARRSDAYGVVLSAADIVGVSAISAEGFPVLGDPSVLVFILFGAMWRIYFGCLTMVSTLDYNLTSTK